MVYNKAMFDTAHVPYPHDGWSYDEFLSDVKRLTLDKNGDGRPDQYGFCGTLEPCLFGASIMSADGKTVTCNTPQMLDFLQTNLDLDEKYKVAPHASQMTNEDFTDLVSVFRQQRFAMMSMFTWNLPYLRDMCRDMSWDIVTNPTIRASGSWASSQAIVISADTKHPDESWEFVRWMLGRQFEESIGRTTMPSRKDVAEQMLERANNSSENDQAILDASENLHRNPLVPEVSEVIQKWKDACASVWTLNATPSQAMARAQHEIERTMAASRRRAD
jgi:multiple sugar transport system substrate-binding protein